MSANGGAVSARAAFTSNSIQRSFTSCRAAKGSEFKEEASGSFDCGLSVLAITAYSWAAGLTECPGAGRHVFIFTRLVYLITRSLGGQQAEGLSWESHSTGSSALS